MSNPTLDCAIYDIKIPFLTLDCAIYDYEFPAIITPDPATFNINEGASDTFLPVISDVDSTLTVSRISAVWPAWVTVESISAPSNSVTITLTASPGFTDSGSYARTYRATSPGEADADFVVTIIVADTTPSGGFNFAVGSNMKTLASIGRNLRN